MRNRVVTLTMISEVRRFLQLWFFFFLSNFWRAEEAAAGHATLTKETNTMKTMVTKNDKKEDKGNDEEEDKEDDEEEDIEGDYEQNDNEDIVVVIEVVVVVAVVAIFAAVCDVYTHLCNCYFHIDIFVIIIYKHL